MNCATWIYIDDPPQDRKSRYETTLYFDCTELRAGRAPSTEGIDFGQVQARK
jgi:hypothetical protein